jgi:hypothetical protein
MIASLAIAAAMPSRSTADEAAKAAVAEFRNQPRFDLPIYIAQPEWTPQFEELYSQFVAQFARGVKQYPGRTVKWYMRNAQINPYADRDPEGLVHYSDCADFPYFLRNYFAYVYGLPMSVATGVEMMRYPLASPATRDADLATARTDNSPYGNYLTGRGLPNVPDKPGREKNFLTHWASILDHVSTRTFRASPLSPNYNEYSDVYPVKIDRNGVRPGTIVHSTGHIYVVAEVDQRGNVYMIDAHPDNSVSYKMLKPSTLDRSRPDQALGFFKFRPARLVGGKYQGNYIYGSRIVLASDRELWDQGLYSLEQWFGPDSNIFPGQRVDPNLYSSAFKSMNFFDFVANRLRDPNVVTYADQAVGELMDSFCEEFKQRVVDVDKAIQVGMTRQYHPNELPQNIYSTIGAWEDYSSPSRDGRLRKAAVDLPSSAVQKFQQSRRSGTGIRFDGQASDFQRAILRKMDDMDRSCTITYKNSQGRQITLGFSELVSRLSKISFDPYHCPERRWGASGSELSSCVDMDEGGRWYNAEQSIRNTAGKLDSNEKLIVRSDRPITIEMLESQRYLDQGPSSQINLGSARSSVPDLRNYFSSAEFLRALGQ